MQTVTYICDKCEKEISEWDVIRIRSLMLIYAYEVPNTQHFDICKGCAIDLGIWIGKDG